MLVEFSIRPMRRPSGVPEVSGEIEPMERGEDAGGWQAMNASIEGSWEHVMSVVRGCHQAHVGGHPRVVTTIIVVDDSVNGTGRGWPRLLEEAARPVAVESGGSSQPVRRIPVAVRE